MVRSSRLLAAFCALPVAFAQTALRVESDLVLVPASVLDRTDHLVLNLPSTQFHVFEDKQEQPLTHFAVEEAPVSVAILFDSSRSMRGSIADARAAVKTILEAGRPDDEIALIEFNDRPALDCPFGSDPSEVTAALADKEARGGTSLLDALLFTMQYVKRAARHPRRAILVFSDAGERDSRFTWTEVRRAAREADLRLYLFLLATTLPEASPEPAILRGIAEETGGRSFEIERGRQFREMAETLELHWHYVLGYRPRRNRHDGRYHKIEVRLDASASNSKLKLFWRKGYVAAP